MSECCIICGIELEPDGEDSVFGYWADGDGPYCNPCWDELD